MKISNKANIRTAGGDWRINPKYPKVLKSLIIQGISDVTVQLIYLNYYRNYQKNSKKTCIFT